VVNPRLDNALTAAVRTKLFLLHANATGGNLDDDTTVSDALWAQDDLDLADIRLVAN
jgi:hypothetical protein